ncbi:rhodanese-like domain-containing protein [Wandonia haliotis]|uniref:Rhodanese-like domain-containing protein n=1 Tax=Wandonia haliotis TaxID=574963 RepID=A0ABN1MNV6_9FLAO
MGLFDFFKGKSTSNEKLAEIVNSGAFLVDVRTPGEYKGGSVKGAVNIPLDRISKELAKFKGKKNIVVFCRSGNRSGQAKMILERNGVENVFNGGTVSKVASLLK